VDNYKIGGKSYFVARYWTGIDGTVAVVAAVNPQLDWAAYVGRVPGTGLASNGVKYVADRGCKLDEKDARHYFGDLAEVVKCKLGYRR
jgi:hypothetical protein